jgi:serine/threonine-protein kinase
LAPAPAFVAGRYLLRERLGAGAVGDVWSAEDPQIGRRVAIKFLRPPDELDAKDHAEWENRFLLEARAAGRLSHPGIVSIHDVGTASDGRPFIVMELVKGQNLDALRSAKPHPTIEQIIRWTIEVAEALDAAHGHNVIHRDIKPANILIGTDGRARITDFGIARVAESDLTRDGFFLGSPAFASPEQLCGEKIDGRADLFSLGAVLYLLATRRRPFEGDAIGTVAYAACHTDPPRPSSVNPELDPAMDGVILRALEKKPGARFQTGWEFAEALRGANGVERTISSRGVSASPTAEDRAVSVASALAVSIVRGFRAGAAEARRLTSAFVAWRRRTAPEVQRGLAAIAARVPPGKPRWWLAAFALFAGVAIALLAGRSSSIDRDESTRHPHVWEQLRAMVGGKTSRVNVVVEHGLETGTIELSESGSVLLSESLRARKKELFGASFLSYRSGTDESKFRLGQGSHELTVKVTGRDGLELAKTVAVQVDPKSEYVLQISVKTWPMKRISADWDVVKE